MHLSDLLKSYFWLYPHMVMNFSCFQSEHTTSQNPPSSQGAQVSYNTLLVQGRQDRIYAHHISTKNPELAFLFRIRYIEYKPQIPFLHFQIL